MSLPDWSRPLPREQFSPEHFYISTQGLHYEFTSQSEADSFYRSCIAKGNRTFILNGTHVINTAYRLSEYPR